VQVNGSEIVREAQLVMLDRDAGEVVLEANSDAALLVLSGEPLNEPIVGYGPFVMNTQEETGQDIADFESGKFSHISDPQRRLEPAGFLPNARTTRITP